MLWLEDSSKQGKHDDVPAILAFSISEDKDDDDDEDGGAEIDSSDSESEEESGGGMDELLAEAFNVGTRIFCEQIKYEHIKKISVICLLLQDECRNGRLSVLSIDFSRQGSCKIRNDVTVRTTSKCFHLALIYLSERKKFCRNPFGI